MIGVIAALTPVFLLIAAGWAARAGRLVEADQFGAINRIGYFLFYPAFLFTTITGSHVEIGEAGRFLAGGVSGCLCVVALAPAKEAISSRACAISAALTSRVEHLRPRGALLTDSCRPSE